MLNLLKNYEELLGILGTSLLGTMLAGKEVRKGDCLGDEVVQVGERVIRAGQDF